MKLARVAEFDATDRAILELLQDNCKQSMTQIGEKVGLSAPSVVERIHKLEEAGVIEVAPLAYMRGRTLSHAFVILDEAQNTTVGQMKMFLTRMGEGSHVVVTGDPSQNDLPRSARSGLMDAVHRLRGQEGIAVQEFSAADVVRHPLVQEIIRAYERHQPGA